MKSSYRCEKCKRKISFMMVDVYTCKCNGLYCWEHKLNHDCSWDWLEEHKQNIEKNNPIVKREKIIKI